jgi:hypothetical protein
VDARVELGEDASGIPGPDPDVQVISHFGQSFFQQRYELAILSGPSPDDPSSVAERGVCELSPQVRAPCDVGTETIPGRISLSSRITPWPGATACRGIGRLFAS